MVRNSISDYKMTTKFLKTKMIKLVRSTAKKTCFISNMIREINLRELFQYSVFTFTLLFLSIIFNLMHLEIKIMVFSVFHNAWFLLHKTRNGIRKEHCRKYRMCLSDINATNKFSNDCFYGVITVVMVNEWYFFLIQLP